MTPIFGKGNFFFGKLGRVLCLHTQRNGHHFWRVKYLLKLGKSSVHRYHVGQKFAEFALSGTVSEIQAFLCFAIQNGRHFLASEIFAETWKGQSSQ